MFKEPLHPFPHTALYIFSLTTPPPSERTHFMCNPKVIQKNLKLIFFTKFVYESLFGRILKKLHRGVFRTQSNINLETSSWYLEPSQTSSWKHQAGAFLKIVNELQILTI